MNLPRRRRIVTTDVSVTDYEEVLDVFDATIAEDARIYVCCTPASSLMFAKRDAALANALADAAVVTPDGMGVVWAARALGESISDRVYGPDLMAYQLGRSAEQGTPMYLYGGHDDDALHELKTALLAQYPGLNIAGSESPPHREPTAAENEATAAAINASGAKIVWVGLGSPKQELWMQANRGRIEAPVLCGVGAAFDFFAGRVEQAPRWMQHNGLEWLYRVYREPVRLGRRYLLTLPAFVFAVAQQKLRGTPQN